MSETVKIAARRSGGRTISYRWAVDGARLVPAQAHPAAVLVGVDTWSASDIDARMPRKTVVSLPVGTIVVDSSRSGGSHEYAAAVLVAGTGPDVLDWARARHDGVVDRKTAEGTARVHVLMVDGVRLEVVEARC